MNKHIAQDDVTRWFAEQAAAVMELGGHGNKYDADAAVPYVRELLGIDHVIIELARGLEADADVLASICSFKACARCHDADSDCPHCAGTGQEPPAALKLLEADEPTVPPAVEAILRELAGIPEAQGRTYQVEVIPRHAVDADHLPAPMGAVATAQLSRVVVGEGVAV